MYHFILISLPLISYTFFLENQNLPRIYITLYDFVVPLIFLGLIFKETNLIKKYFSHHKNEFLFLVFIMMGCCITLSQPEFQYKNTIKDFLKIILFIMALCVYKIQFEKWKPNTTYLNYIVLASVLLLYIRHDHTDAGYSNTTPLTNFTFFIWVLSSYLSKNNTALYALSTSLTLSQFIFFTRSELIGFMFIVLASKFIDYYHPRKEKLKFFFMPFLLITIGIFFFLKSFIIKSLLIRLALWKISFFTGLDHLPWGIGLGQYQAQQVMSNKFQIKGGEFNLFQYPHNQFLYWFCELGVFGIALGFIFIRIMLTHLSYLDNIWKYSIFGIIFIATNTHDIISVRVVPIFLALIYSLSKQEKVKRPTTTLP